MLCRNHDRGIPRGLEIGSRAEKPEKVTIFCTTGGNGGGDSGGGVYFNLKRKSCRRSKNKEQTNETSPSANGGKYTGSTDAGVANRSMATRVPVH